MKKASSKHRFAFYFEKTTTQFDSVEIGNEINITDPLLCHRILKVVRLKPKDQFILFDQSNHIYITIQNIKSTEITGIATKKEENIVLTPKITFFLPILKRAAFENAMYSLVELGANSIQPITTEKIHRSWGGTKELARIKKIIHSAAEQSKNFAFPLLYEPKPLDIFFSHSNTATKIFFDPHGQSLDTTIEQIQQTTPNPLALLIGPEGDLSAKEKQQLQKNHITFCALTPTILRSEQAAAVALGAFRSLLQ
jgi:16S rRNA (uracil1498-N3)-methyltransferase